MTDLYWVMLFLFCVFCFPALLFHWSRPRGKLFWLGMWLTVCSVLLWFNFLIPTAEYSWGWDTLPEKLFFLTPAILFSMFIIVISGMVLSTIIAGFRDGEELT